MEAIQFNPVKQELNLVKKEKPKAPVGDEVLVKVAYSGICGTDLHIAEVSQIYFYFLVDIYFIQLK